MIQIQFAHEHPHFRFAESRARQAMLEVLSAAGLEHASISVAIVDDPTIHELNRRYLEHDYPTDVLSFLLESGDWGLEGEVIASADTAERMAGEAGWSIDDELLLYVVHGTLHLVGYDDQEPAGREQMRQREREVLARFGLSVRHEQASTAAE